MRKVAALIIILGLFFSVAVSAEEIPQEVHIQGYDTIIVGIFEIWKHSDGAWQDTDLDGRRDKPYDIDPRIVTAQLQASIPAAVLNQYDNVRAEIIPMDWEKDDTGENQALFEKDKDGYSATIKEDMGLSVDAKAYLDFYMQVLGMRPLDYKGTGNKDGRVEFTLRSDPTLELKRTWQGQQVEGYGFYLPALVQYYGVPKAIDIEAVEIKRTCPTLVDTNQVSTAVFRNNGGSKTAFTAQYYACGTLVKEETLELAPGQYIHKNFSWKSPKAAGTYNLKIHAVPLLGENNTGNNTKEISVVVRNYNYTKPDCEFCSKLTSNWDEMYSWEVEHESCSTWTDPVTGESGEDCYTWIEIVSQTVPYSENLSAVVTVNTKQGIPTDRDNPKESDREGRGSWEIIPWAQSNGLDPNEVTRAGYGFEVQVKTTYWTNWETKVPGLASPHGGEYEGPTKVVAQFYDTSGYFVEQLEMVPTKGKAGDRSITWELPLKRYDFTDGTCAWVRKHYTDVRNKDGSYGVRIVIFDCGREPLSICQDKYVTIYGDMYDDIYTRSATSDEWYN